MRVRENAREGERVWVPGEREYSPVGPERERTGHWSAGTNEKGVAFAEGR